MKKFFCVFMGLLVMGGLLSGCGNTGSGQSTAVAGSTQAEGQTDGSSAGGGAGLTMWYWNRSVDDALIAEAGEASGVAIDNQKIGGDYTAKVVTTIAGGGELPDILCFNDNVSKYLQFPDKFVNLLEAPFNADEIKDLYLDWKWQQGVSIDGKTMIAIPMDTGPVAMMYRADVFEELGLPSEPDDVSNQIKTWDDWYNAGLKAKEAGYFFTDNIGEGLYGQMNTQDAIMLFDEEDNTTIESDPKKREYFDFAVKASESGLSANVDRWTPEWNSIMNDNKVVAYVGAVWMKQPLIEGAVDTSGKWRVAKKPGAAANHGGSFIGLSQDGKNKEKAWEVIKYLQNDESQKKALSSLNLYPATLKNLNDPAIFQAQEFFGGQVTDEVFAEAAKEIKPFYFSPYEGNARNIIYDELKTVGSGEQDADKAWSTIIRRINTEIEK